MASTFLKAWAVDYLLLVATYLITGAVVSWLNRAWVPHLRIQDRTCRPDLVRRDFLTSLKSLSTVAALMAAGQTLALHGWGWEWRGQGWGAVALSALGVILAFDAWFYWGHRLLHTEWWYARAHAWHHATTVPTVWSNNSDTHLDNLVMQGFWALLPFLMPVHPGLALGIKLVDQVIGMLGHAGYEYAPSPLSRAPAPFVATTFHDDHHKLFQVNFGTYLTFWDRVCGTIDPAYDAKVDGLIERDRAAR